MFCVLALGLNAQTIDVLLDGGTFSVISPNCAYLAGNMEDAAVYYNVLTKKIVALEGDVQDDGGCFVWDMNDKGQLAVDWKKKAAIWSEADEFEILPYPEGLTSKEKRYSAARCISNDGKYVVVSFGSPTVSIYLYTKGDDGIYTMEKMTLPEIDPIYNQIPQYIAPCGMTDDGNRILCRYRVESAEFELPFVIERTSAGENWSIRWIAPEFIVEGGKTDAEFYGIEFEFDGDPFADSIGFENAQNEWLQKREDYYATIDAVSTGYYYAGEKGDLSDLAMSANGKYAKMNISYKENMSDENAMVSNYPAVIDLETEQVYVFTCLADACCLSVTNDGLVSLGTPRVDYFRYAHISSIADPTKSQTLTEWTKEKTNGKINLADYMTYETYEGTKVAEGSAILFADGSGFMTNQYNGFGDNQRYETYVVDFEDVEEEDDGENDEEDDTEKPNMPEIFGDTLKFGDVDYCIGAIFNKVSNNGKFVAGYASSDLGGSNVGFVYIVEEDSMLVLNPEWEDNVEQSHLVKATAMDVSDAGIVVGQYAFDDMQVRPAFYNITTGAWTELERPANVVGKEPRSLYGEATSISADGKYIGGYVIAQMDNSTRYKQVRRNVACVWVRTNDDEINPIYELQMPIDEEHTKIMDQGDWAWHMSDDAKWLGGNSSANSGCYNVAIWENNYTDTLERTVLIGKSDWDRSEDDNEDGKIDDEDGVDPGQYFWQGVVSCISPSGEWVVGYHTFNGTGYSTNQNLSAVGFRYNTKTKELQDTLFGGLPTVVFDDGEMIYSNTGVMSSSDDKKVQCGTYVINIAGLPLNVPLLIIDREEDNTEDDDGDEDITEEEVYGLYAASENPEMGGVKIILMAEAIEGFEFVEWSDGNTVNPRIIELTEDTELYARFRVIGETTDVENSKISVAEVYSRDGVLYVEGAEGDYHVLDMAGRLIYSGRKSALNLPRGVYLVTIAGEVEKVVL